MSIIGALRQAQLASKASQVTQPAGNRLNLADQLRLKQMERMLQQTLEELAQLKARVEQLEKLEAHYSEHEMIFSKGNEETISLSSTPPLPVDEIKELAEMAKRFR
jgi:hypothetical protein